jgi:hypothetical protein
MSTPWPTGVLSAIDAADDLQISPLRENGAAHGTPTWIWAVVVDGDLYVRGYNGVSSSWYQAARARPNGRIHAAGVVHEVTFAPAAADLADRIDDAYGAKYAASPYLEPMVSPRARMAGIRIRLQEPAATGTVIGVVVSFMAPGGSVDVTIDEDNPATRDFLSMLPLTLTFEDFAGREKIAYLPRDLRFAGSPPSAAGTGDVAIYTPWGNLAFFYDAQHGPPSPEIVHLGTFSASRDQLTLLEHGNVSVAVAR